MEGKESDKKTQPENAKLADLARDKVDQGTYITTNQGLLIDDDENTLKAGARGPSLIEDFHFREKITHFDHERIPERVVHARGAAAHGYFQPFESAADITKAKLFADPSKQTPVFLRFSTVAGSRGSADTPRDVRGFAVKFYTEEGNWDLVGNNIPVFFIQDAINFPDLIHSVKPEPHNEIPQAASAHNTFWDFASLKPESAHMLMWVYSDRALPRSFATLEGFGIHSFRFINAEGVSRFVKFHFKPVKGVQSQVWDEAQKTAGKNPDFHRQDLWDAIERGDFPEWQMGVQVIEEADEDKFDFDLLDSTKIVPEELVPIRPLGKLVLNRNPDYYFGETEQVAFCPGHIVPGIDFSNDPLLQGRLHSYLDTQITRIGVNFAQLPINRPICPMRNNQRDGKLRSAIYQGVSSYAPTSLGGPKVCPYSANSAVFKAYAEPMTGTKLRAKGKKFADHFSQATLFWNSMASWEKDHIVGAFSFELNHIESDDIRKRVVEEILSNIHPDLASRVAENLGITFKQGECEGQKLTGDKTSPALSMDKPVKNVAGRVVACLTGGSGVNAKQIEIATKLLAKEGILLQKIAPHGGKIKGADGSELEVDAAEPNAASPTFDAAWLPSNDKAKISRSTYEFINDQFWHGKPIVATGEKSVGALKNLHLPGIDLADAGAKDVRNSKGVITSAQSGDDVSAEIEALIAAFKRPRFHERDEPSYNKV